MSRSSIRIAAVLLTVMSMSASATHFAVAKSTPSKDQKLSASPKRIQVWFSQAPAAGVSQLKLHGADKAEIPLDKTVVDKDKSMYADVPKPLAAGDYTIVWRAAGDDGHVLNGEIKFTIAPK